MWFVDRTKNLKKVSKMDKKQFITYDMGIQISFGISTKIQKTRDIWKNQG